MSIRVHTVETPGLGDRSYLATDGTVAVVIDPQRDLERIFGLAASLGVAITHVFETHIHNDYVSGGLALAEAAGARYVVSADEDVAFARLGVTDGDIVDTGSMRIQVVATPGHTLHHLAYVVSEAATGEVAGTFTGGSVLFGTVGRTDLSGAEHTHALAHAQWRSARRLVGLLPDGAVIWPTHGFGSFCSGAGGSGAVESTAGAERSTNTALVLDQQSFVTGFLAGLGPYPAYYRHMGPLNRKGAPPLAAAPPLEADVAELRRRLTAGEWVVDLRPRARFAAGHLPGALNVEGIAAVATYVGWIVPWGEPLSLIGPDEPTLEAASIALARIDIEPVSRHLADIVPGVGGCPPDTRGVSRSRTSTVGFGPTHYPVGTFADLAAARQSSHPLTILDVRADDEWRESHLPGALHIPWHDIPARMAELPIDRDIWVHCAAGLRASIAASLLQRSDRRPVLVDDRWCRVYDAGLDVEEAA